MLANKMENDIENYREDILDSLAKIFDELRHRQSVLTQLISSKEREELDYWIPKREQDVFNKIHPRTLDEVKLLSILIENQMIAITKDYPKWSDSIHVLKKEAKDWEKINPVFLYLFDSSLMDLNRVADPYKSKLMELKRV